MPLTKKFFLIAGLAVVLITAVVYFGRNSSERLLLPSGDDLASGAQSRYLFGGVVQKSSDLHTLNLPTTNITMLKMDKADPILEKFPKAAVSTPDLFKNYASSPKSKKLVLSSAPILKKGAPAKINA